MRGSSSWATGRCASGTRRWSRRPCAPTPTSSGSCRPMSAAPITRRATCCSARRRAARSASSRSRRWPPGARSWRPTPRASATSSATASTGCWSTSAPPPIRGHGVSRTPPTDSSSTQSARRRLVGGGPQDGRRLRLAGDHGPGAGALRAAARRAASTLRPGAQRMTTRDPKSAGAAGPLRGVADRLAGAPLPVGRRGDLLRGGARDAARPCALPRRGRSQTAAHLPDLRGRRRRWAGPATACCCCTS